MGVKGVAGRRVSIISRVSGFQGPRVKGFQGLNGFKGTKGPRASGFQGIEGFPMLSRAFKEIDVLTIQRFQGLRDEGVFRAPRSKGYRAKEPLGSHRSKGLKVPRA